MSALATNPAVQRSRSSLVFSSVLRVLFTTLLFTAGGMAVGLFFGIIGTVVFGMMRGGQIDMTNAYRHVAIPIALLAAVVALVGSAILEVRTRTRTSL